MIHDAVAEGDGATLRKVFGHIEHAQEAEPLRCVPDWCFRGVEEVRQIAILGFVRKTIDGVPAR